MSQGMIAREHALHAMHALDAQEASGHAPWATSDAPRWESHTVEHAMPYRCIIIII